MTIDEIIAEAARIADALAHVAAALDAKILAVDNVADRCTLSRLQHIARDTANAMRRAH